MDILVLMQFSELPEMLKGILLLCGHCVFKVNLEMYKAIIIYQIWHFKQIFVSTIMWEGIEIGQIVVQVFISISLNYVTCDIFIHLVHN